jgi:chromosome segregation ATPase
MANMTNDEAPQQTDHQNELSHHVENIVRYISRDVQDVVKPHVERLQAENDDMQKQLQDMKSYVLALEERIVLLENDNIQHKSDFKEVGSHLANLSSEAKIITENNHKKKHFWKK